MLVLRRKDKLDSVDIAFKAVLWKKYPRHRIRGGSYHQAKKIFEEAIALQEAGAKLIVLEAMPAPVATFITNQLDIPTIGIGAGSGTSGQVLVQMDLLGMFDRFLPR